MKKFILTFSLLTASLLMVSCNLLKGKQEEAPAPVAAPQPSVIRVYANAYDGYVNVRSAPTLKSTVLGRLKNGEDFLPQVGVQGKWIAVQYQGGVGYVASDAAGYTPWKPVYLGVDGKTIQGMYSNGYNAYLVFSNGKYAYIYEYGDLSYGTWIFEGMDIIFTTKYITSDGRRLGSEWVGRQERLPVRSKVIGNYKKETLYSRSYYSDYEYSSCGAWIVTKEDFAATRKTVNKLVRITK